MEYIARIIQISVYPHYLHFAAHPKRNCSTNVIRQRLTQCYTKSFLRRTVGLQNHDGKLHRQTDIITYKIKKYGIDFFQGFKILRKAF